MAKLSRSDILKLARLSRLKLSDAEIEKFQHEIGDIISYVDMLKDVDVGSLKPTYQVTGLVNVTREDEVKDYGITQEELLKNVPKTEDKYLKVKRMIG
jgi:aspartyl-tRNA(Asn)/glutamyl-tRNA(Gln) amidotransferase subunit C